MKPEITGKGSHALETPELHSRTNLLRKNFLPNRSMATIVQMFPGNAAKEMMKELTKTAASGGGEEQKGSSSGSRSEDMFVTSHTVLVSL